MVRQFANGSRFARTIHAGHHQHHGLLIANLQLFLQGHQHVGDGVNQQGFDSQRLSGLGCFDPGF